MFGINGNPGSGKTAAGKYLNRLHGFYEFSGSDYLKQKATERRLRLVQRDDYRILQRRLRDELSRSFVADASIAVPAERVANIGIRNKLDAQKHLKVGGIIVALYCPLEIRFSRTAGSDPKYPDTLEEFIAAEAPEYDDPDPYGQHTDWTMAHAHHSIDTSRPIENLYKALAEIVATHTA